MFDLDARAECVKLARLLEVEPADIAFVEQRPAAETRAFREAVSDAIFDSHRHGFQRLAGLTRLIPAGIAATLAEKLMGAVMSARVAGELEPESAVNLARKLSVQFLTRVSVELEPRRARAVVAGMPADIVVPVATALVAKQDWITLGRFVDAVSLPALKACVKAIQSDEALLRIGFFIENKHRLDEVIRLLPTARLEGLIKAATVHSLWPETLSLIVHLSDEMKGRLGDLTANQSPEVLGRLMLMAEERSLWPAMLVAVASMSPENRRRAINQPTVADPVFLRNLVGIGHEAQMWHQLLPLMQVMDEPLRTAAAEVAMTLPPEVLAGVFDSVVQHELWDDAIALFTALPPALQEQAGTAAAKSFDGLFRKVWAQVEEYGRGDELAALYRAYHRAGGKG